TPANASEPMLLVDSNSWSDWFEWRFSANALRKNQINPDILLACTEHLSKPLTACYALQKHPQATSWGSTLTIHVVGADEYELCGSGRGWEEVLHFLAPSGPEALTVCFIGPNLASIVNDDVSLQNPIQLCKECEQKNRSLQFEFVASEYEVADLPAPALVVAFNCGFHHETESWTPAIKKMISSDTVVCFTSFDEVEAHQDVDVFVTTAGSTQLSFTAVAQVNPCRSLVPFLDLRGGDMFQCRNSHLSICSVKK
ncbi:hypothetical protein HDU82_002014, partial [Entophlyctis luteolus]